jgi:glycosyltransferase involved in cell wall biosynthesis
MKVEVSVIVAVYNSGDRIDRVIASVLGQSLAEVELIPVDDGSTDGTGAKLEALAASEPRVRYRRIPNSGWPGRPRNLGLEMARGDYVLFMDHDDALFPESLERLLEYAVKCGSDVVIGKEVRSGARTMGLDLFRRNIAQANLAPDRLMDLPTPHKLYRRAFLIENGIRFAEGRRRLEDLLHLVQVLAASPTLSVLSDYPCYQWVIHDDNNSVRVPEPVGYYANLGEVLDSIDRWPSIEDRRAGYLHCYAERVLGRFGPGGFRTWSADIQPSFFSAARGIMSDRFPVELDRSLSSMHQIRAGFLREDDIPGMLAHSEAESEVRTAPQVVSASWEEGALVLTARTVLDSTHGPLRFDHRGDHTVLRPFGPLESRRRPALDVTFALADARADLFLVERRTNAEWFIPAEAEVSLVSAADGAGLVLEGRVSAHLDPATAVFGSPMHNGIWDLRLRLHALGFDSRPTARIDADLIPKSLDVAGLGVTPYATKNGRLAFKVASSTSLRNGASRTRSQRPPRPLWRRAAGKLRRTIRS